MGDAVTTATLRTIANTLLSRDCISAIIRLNAANRSSTTISSRTGTPTTFSNTQINYYNNQVNQLGGTIRRLLQNRGVNNRNIRILNVANLYNTRRYVNITIIDNCIYFR